MKKHSEKSQDFKTSRLQHFKLKSSQVIEYEEALRKNVWKGERKLADERLHYVKRLNLNYRFDKLINLS